MLSQSSGSPALYIYKSGSPEDAYQLWPETDEIPSGVIREKNKYVFELRGIDHPLSAELTIEREEVQPLRPPEDLSAARWSWSPGFHAGAVDLHIDLGNGREASIRVVTDPDIRKLTRGQFNRMVQDILNDTFALFNLSGFKAGIARGNGGQVPPIARLEFLRSRMEDLEEAIRRVARRPVRLLRSETRSLPLHKISSATGPEIARSFRTEEIREEPPGRSQLPSGFKGYFPGRIRKSTQSSGLDIREHRDMKSSLRSWSQWLRVVADRLETEGNADKKDSKYLESRRCRKLSHRLQNLLRLSFFENVTERSAPVRITSIYRRIPAYRSFFQIHNDLNLGVARIAGDFLEVPLARTFDLYEIWCFLRLLRAAAKHLTEDEVDVDPIFDFDPSSKSVTVAAEHVEIPLGSKIVLCFKRQYKEYWLTQTGRGSFSRTMEPDLSLSLPAIPSGVDSSTPQVCQDTEIHAQEAQVETASTKEGGTETPPTDILIVLDAKYRIESGLNEAIASIHTYRDALVEDHGDRSPRIVNGAYLLSPLNLDDSEPDWQSTDMPHRLFHPKYRGAFHFGAVTLRPGMSLDQVQDALQAILADTGVETGSRVSTNQNKS